MSMKTQWMVLAIVVSSSNGTFHFSDAVVEGLSILYEGTKLSMLHRGHVYGFELPHGSHASELEGVVFVGFAFNVGPLPSVFIGGTDQCFVSEADS